MSNISKSRSLIICFLQFSMHRICDAVAGTEKTSQGSEETAPASLTDGQPDPDRSRCTWLRWYSSHASKSGSRYLPAYTFYMPAFQVRIIADDKRRVNTMSARFPIKNAMLLNKWRRSAMPIALMHPGSPKITHFLTRGFPPYTDTRNVQVPVGLRCSMAKLRFYSKPGRAKTDLAISRFLMNLQHIGNK